MSDFVGFCVIPIEESVVGFEAVRERVDARIELREVDGGPFCAAVRGGAKNRPVYMLLHGGTSTEILGRGRRKASLVLPVVESLERLVGDFGGVRVLHHVFRGRVSEERIDVAEVRRLGWPDFRATYPSLVPDMLYVVLR